MSAWRESTSTSPSGQHLAFYRSITAFECTPQEADTPRASDRFFGVIANMVDAALQIGFVFERWRNVVNAMIEKLPGRPQIHKLRVIHLLEADLNLALGIIWSRRLMKQGEKLGQFYPLAACRGYLRDGNGGYVTSREIRTLRTALPENELRVYLQQRNCWSNKTYNSINWSAYSSAGAGLTDNARTFVVKLIHNWLPIGIRERRCSATTDLCQHCDQRVETVPHCTAARSENRGVIGF
jgi:hypothetical protein